MKYGILTFKLTENIGDDIQSYAEKRFLPHYEYFIERDNLMNFKSENNETVSAIMNAWYITHGQNFYPAPCINPLFVAMHITETKKEFFTTGYGKKYLSNYKIGARDYSTLKLLQEAGLDTYFSGCLTLTLPKFDNVEKKDYIVVVDVSDEEYEYIKAHTNSEVIRKTHNVDTNIHSQLSFEDRFLKVEELLKLYQSAKLVITSRLHVALPCLALETPVLLINEKKHADRFSSFLPLLHYMSSKEFLDSKCDFNTITENKKDYLVYRENLINICTKFISDCENGKYDRENREFSAEEILEVTNWQKDLLAKEKMKKHIKLLNLEKTIAVETEKIKNFRIKNFIDSITTTSDFSIISSNCIGGIIYHDLNRKFLSPTVNLYFNGHDFLKFVSNLDYYLNLDIKLEYADNGITGYLDDIELYFLHYDSIDDAREKWNIRKSRIIKDKIFIICTDRDGFDEQDFIKFKALNYPKLLITRNADWKDETFVLYLEQYAHLNEVDNTIHKRDFYETDLLANMLNNI